MAPKSVERFSGNGMRSLRLTRRHRSRANSPLAVPVCAALESQAGPGCRRTRDQRRECLLVGVVLNIENGKREPASIKDLIDLTAADMGRVNKLILSKAGSDVEMIPEVANHLISSGGKRLRPMLTLAMARLAGYTGDGHIKLAASVEFMHTATLLHDDVVDESDMRRGRLPARLPWGDEAK